MAVKTVKSVHDKWARRAASTITDPVRFSQIALGHDTWDTQEAIIRAVVEHSQVAVKACHSSSKTFSAADLVIWWVVRFQKEGGKVITTAPGMSQVKLAMWGQIRKAIEGAKIRLPDPDLTQLRVSADSYAIGLSTNEHMRFAGYKGEKLLIIVDEGPGVRQLIWDAIDGLKAGGDVHILTLGQPLATGGTYYDAFHKHRNEWRTFTIDAFDTPNLRGVPGRNWEEKLSTLAKWDEKGDPRLLENERTYLCTRKWVLDMSKKWTTDHFFWDARVRGQFSKQSEAAIVPLAWLEPADTSVHKEAPHEIDDSWEDYAAAEIVAGVDPAGPGSNLTVLYVRHREHVIERHEWPEPLPTNKVVEVLRRYKAVKQINVDATGIGYGMAQALEQQQYSVAYVYVGDPARDKERFANLKAELYWSLRDRFSDGDVTGVLGAECVGQLASIEYRPDARQRIMIEKKEELEARGIPSPDHAEALMLCFAEVPVAGGRTDIELPALRR